MGLLDLWRRSVAVTRAFSAPGGRPYDPLSPQPPTLTAEPRPLVRTYIFIISNTPTTDSAVVYDTYY